MLLFVKWIEGQTTLRSTVLNQKLFESSMTHLIQLNFGVISLRTTLVMILFHLYHVVHSVIYLGGRGE